MKNLEKHFKFSFHKDKTFFFRIFRILNQDVKSPMITVT